MQLPTSGRCVYDEMILFLPITDNVSAGQSEGQSQSL